MPLLVAALMLLAQAAPALPPPYPRAGTTKLLENDQVIVWDVAWLEQQYPLHTHRYDLVGMSYVDGDRIILQEDGTRRRISTSAWTFQTQRAGVTHYEEGVGEPPMRSIQIELKSPGPRGTSGQPVRVCDNCSGHRRPRMLARSCFFSGLALPPPRIVTGPTRSRSCSTEVNPRLPSCRPERATVARCCPPRVGCTSSN